VWTHSCNICSPQLLRSAERFKGAVCIKVRGEKQRLPLIGAGVIPLVLEKKRIMGDNGQRRFGSLFLTSW